jgi:hypothetical protein
MSEVDKLRAEIETLKRRLDALEGIPPSDEQRKAAKAQAEERQREQDAMKRAMEDRMFAMPPSPEMLKHVPDGLVRDIVRDGRQPGMRTVGAGTPPEESKSKGE